MKTSNKLLTGAFSIFIIGLIGFNIALKKEIDKAKNNPEFKIEQQNSLNPDSISIKINVNQRRANLKMLQFEDF